MPNTFDDDIYFRVDVTFNKSVALPDGTVSAADIKASAGIETTKLEGEHQYTFSKTGTLTTTTEYFAVIKGSAGAMEAIECVLNEVIPDGDKTITIDVQRSRSAAAYATILSATVVLDSANVLRTIETGVFSDPVVQDGDLLKLTLTTGGSSGTDPEGVCVSIKWREDN